MDLGSTALMLNLVVAVAVLVFVPLDHRAKLRPDLIPLQNPVVRVSIEADTKDAHSAPLSIEIPANWMYSSGGSQVVGGDKYPVGAFGIPGKYKFGVYRQAPSASLAVHRQKLLGQSGEKIDVHGYGGVLKDEGFPAGEANRFRKYQVFLQKPSGEFIFASMIVMKTKATLKDKSMFLDIVRSIEPR